jgi:iron-sulfur cluster assembly protein
MAITATAKALAEIKRLMAEREKPPRALRVGIKGGGCTGFAYMFEWTDDEPGKHDRLFELDDGVRLVVDLKSYIYLAGSEIDYVSGLMGQGFKFQNPNVKGTCGCGQSVQF